MADTNPFSSDADRRAAEEGINIAYSLLGTPLEFRAEALTEKLMQRFPADPRVHITQADLRHRAGRLHAAAQATQRAEALAEKLVQRFPADPYLHLTQADLWRRTGRLPDAAQAAQRALVCDPGNGTAQRLAAALRGEALPVGNVIGAPAPVRLLRSFFEPSLHRQLLDMALTFEPQLAPSGVSSINPNADWRRSKANDTPAAFKALTMDRILEAAREAVIAFAMSPFLIESVEMQFTAHNDGDFYKAHRDHGEGGMEHRRLTFVYYFNRQPRGFSGGGLALFDSLTDGSHYSAQLYSLVEPMDNSLIVFPSAFWHEVQKVGCPSGAYADSRFTLNGWIGVKRLKDAAKNG